MTADPDRGGARALRAVVALLWLAAVGLGPAPDVARPEDRAPDGIPRDADRPLRALVLSGRDEDLTRPDFAALAGAATTFYERLGWAAHWTREGIATPAARALVARFEAAANQGLRPADYDAGRWADRLRALAPPRPGDAALRDRFDLAVTVCALRYVRDVHLGRVDPRRLAFPLPAKPFDAADFLARLEEADAPAAALDALEPPFLAYRRLRDALPRYVELARRPQPSFTARAVPGERLPAAEALARQLLLLGDLAPGERWTTGVYEGPLVDAVRRFQRRHGLEPDGRIGKATLAALDVPLARRVEQMQLTLERWRWLPERFAAPPIVVNIPEFRLRALRVEGADLIPELSLKVVVGAAFDHQTPVLAGALRYVLFHPYWNVPRPIVEEEILPALAADPRYLAAHDYELYRADAGRVATFPETPETLELLRRGALDLRQRPGPGNALGAVKLVFANDRDIYLHDTPAKSAFAASRRDLSHGCVRVEDAAALVRWVLRDQPEWTPARIADALAAPPVPLRVDLRRPVAVFLLYGTALASRNGEISFFEDIYGHDRALAAALASGTAP